MMDKIYVLECKSFVEETYIFEDSYHAVIGCFSSKRKAEESKNKFENKAKYKEYRFFITEKKINDTYIDVNKAFDRNSPKYYVVEHRTESCYGVLVDSHCIIGIFSSRAKAEHAVELCKNMKRFRKHKNGFEIFNETLNSLEQAFDTGFDREYM